MLNLKRARRFGVILFVMMSAPWVARAQPVTDVHKAITQDSQWLNTSRALKPDDLRGRIILLDFWTFCCINCIHVMPDLKALEAQFKGDLTVIGVHSAKFNNERDTENIRNAILRYGLEHPVVNDASFRIWDSFHVESWPTFVLINPAGQIENVYQGEGHREELAGAIAKLKREYAGKINRRPLPIQLEKDKVPPAPLSFPGKIAYAGDFEKAPALFVSDSSHNRIVALRLNGDIFLSVGRASEPGFKDGDFTSARFNKPQGVLYKNGVLYVADTGNHALRKVDLNRKSVETVAGTGKIGDDRDVSGAPALTTALNSPWDLAFYPDDRHIAIAMAGLHQIWSYDLEKKTVSVIAGDGRESIVDGDYPSNSLAQTSGLAVSGGKLYFVDSETSSLRVLEGKTVRTLIGSGLFDFGFQDGPKGKALLQHDIGIAAHGGFLYIADSYNHAIRKYDPRTGILETVAGINTRGNDDGALKEARFNEPNGLAFDGDKAFVTDTNNNEIRIIDFAAGKVSTLPVHEKSASVIELADNLPNLKKSPIQEVRAGEPLDVALVLDKGWHINDLAPSYLALFEGRSRPRLIISFGHKELQAPVNHLPPLKSGLTYRLQGTFYYCQIKEGSACKLMSRDLKIRAVDVAGKTRRIELRVGG